MDVNFLQHYQSKFQELFSQIQEQHLSIETTKTEKEKLTTEKK